MRTKTGIVVSTKMEKTAVIAVVTYKRHPKYLKKYQTTKKFYAHDENELCKKGDTVSFIEHRPLSKLKHWKVTEINGQAVESVKKTAKETPVETETEDSEPLVS